VTRAAAGPSPYRAPSRAHTLFACGALAVSFLVTPRFRAAEAPAPALEAEAGAPLIRAFKPRDYLGSPAVTRVLAHPATGELLMLDGTRLHIFNGSAWTSVETNTPGARCLSLDAAGRAWLGGVDHFGYAERDGLGDWRFYPLAEKLPVAERKIGRIWDCVVLGDAVWFATDTKVIRWQAGAAHVWTFPGTGTLLGAGGRLFFQLKNTALLRWDGTDFREISRDPLVAGPSVVRLYAAEAGTLVGMNSAGGFFRLREDRIEPFAPAFKATLGNARLICALPRPGGGWYGGTDRSGILVTDAEGRLVRRIDRTAGLTDSPVMDLALDRDGALWAATLAGPFQIAQPEGATFYAETLGVPQGFAQSLARHQGRLYLSTATGLLQLIPATAAGPAAFKPVPGSPRYTQKMLARPDGLLVTHGAGLTRLHDDQLTQLITTDGANSLISIAQSADGRWLFVGRSAGFTVYAYADGAAREVRHFPDLGQIRTVHVDAAGAVWLGTSSRGVHRLQPGPAPAPWAEPKITTFDTANGTLPGASDSVYAVDSPFGPVFHTESGLVRFDPAAQRLVPETRFRHGEEPVSSIGMSARAGGDTWGSVNFDREKSLPLYGRLRGAAFTPAPAPVHETLGPVDGGAVLVEGSGADETVWFKTVESLVRLRPAALVPARADWAAQLTRFEADGAPQPLASPARASFRASRRPYVFTFQAPHLAPGAQVEYQSRLVGWDSAWTAWSPSPEVRFSALPSGDYRFEVRARDRLGHVTAPAALAFQVTPPLWLTGWALGLYALATLGAIFAYDRWRLRRGERERRRLEGLVAARTAELATARDQAEAANRAKSSFLAAMSHELRTPLNGVIGYAQILQADTRLQPDQQERLRIVQSSGEHLLRMINDVLDLAKIEAGKIELRPAPFALGDLLADVAATHTIASAAKGLAFHLAAADLPPWIKGDAQKLRQILDNLLSNAVKFTAAGSVTLGVTKPAPLENSDSHRSTLSSQLIAFAITDTGPGISENDQLRLFQPFEQARDNRPEVAGTGLGLAISHVLVAHLGGHLTLTSKPGVGSTFTFTLPLPPVAPDTATNAAGHRIAGFIGESRRVLIVDDHAVNRCLLVDLLTPLGFTCAEFASPTDALARLTGGAEPWPDLAILDLRMDGLDGLELTRRLRALPRGPQLKILLTTASVFTFSADDARRAGCDDFLPKPFRTAELLEKLGRLLGLTWRESDFAPPSSAKPSAVTPLPAATRAALREILATGDLAAFTAGLEKLRASEPESAAALEELSAAAASFRLAQLRQLLE
jgi:signal transduction histidine kinase/DNA-binding response OmpR family regulator